jgi:hypothetical protein
MVVVELLSRLSYFMGRVGVGVGLGGRNERFRGGSDVLLAGGIGLGEVQLPTAGLRRLGLVV